MRKIKCIPSRSGLFGPFNVNVIIFAVCLIFLLVCVTHVQVFQMLSNNRTYLKCKSDVYYINMQNRTLKCKFQKSNLPETVKTVEPYERLVGPLGSVATPFALIFNG